MKYLLSPIGLLGPEGGFPTPRSGRPLVFFTEKIAHPHNGIGLFSSQSRQQVSPN